MAKVILTGLEQATANQIGRALQDGRHQIEHKTDSAHVEDFLGADIVFADGSGKGYIALLRRIRKAFPALPFVVVTGNAEGSDLLDALEAGATDYCSTPVEPRQIMWIMETAIVRAHTAAA